jgi:hypothetical protein
VVSIALVLTALFGGSRLLPRSRSFLLGTGE